MRALCGAIITAGALIGLGLAAVGIGIRYENFARYETDPVNFQMKFWHMDTGLMYVVVFLTLVSLVGLAVSFLGLAYHHERRHREHLHRFQGHPDAGRSVTS